MDYLKKISNVIEQTLEYTPPDKLVIYPYGSLGMEVERILKLKYGIHCKYIIDNGLASKSYNNRIISLEEFKRIKSSDIVVLLSSINPQNYNFLRKQLYDVVSKNQVVDVFSLSMFYDKSMYYELPNLKSQPRLGTLEMVAREIYKNNVSGSLAEVGVFRGDFAKEIVKLIPDRKMYLFDTFEGFDERDIGQGDEYIINFQNSQENFKGTSIDMVINNIGDYNDLVIKKGYFPETAIGIDHEMFAFVSLDTDLYKPIKAGLEIFWDKMSPGGYIFVHDYTWGRVQDAVREFAKETHAGFIPITDDCHSIIFVKPY